MQALLAVLQGGGFQRQRQAALQALEAAAPADFPLRRVELGAGTDLLVSGALPLTPDQRCTLPCLWSCLSLSRASGKNSPAQQARTRKAQRIAHEQREHPQPPCIPWRTPKQAKPSTFLIHRPLHPLPPPLLRRRGHHGKPHGARL